ncbi:MAG TPA: ATP-binding protein [Terriglobia bacterium]|nr:ATP-binding protein [Terriglobia bacterium]
MPTLLSTRQESPTLVPEVMPQMMMDPGSLAQAFEAFTSTADSLQYSYGVLQTEVGRLRQELELRNRDLAHSLAENERMRVRLGHILENLPCGVMALTPQLKLHYANDIARRLLASASAASDSAGPIPASLRRLLKQIISSAPGAEREWVLGEEKDPVFINITCALIPRTVESRQELVFILRDITEQKRLEEEREVSRRMRALAEMTALLAHEIRNPLGSLELFAGLVKDATREEEEVSQWMVHLQAGLRALSATVNNVLHFYSQAPLETVPVNLVKLLTGTIEFLQPLALQRGMAIIWAPPEGSESEITISADQHRLQQVFFNITINALKAMSAGGTVTVRVSTERRAGRSWARVAFADRGAGIPAENLAKIFEAGFTTNRTSPGLGLAVCKRVMNQHGGTLEASSVEGQGTTFTLSFPVLEA